MVVYGSVYGSRLTATIPASVPQPAAPATARDSGHDRAMPLSKRGYETGERGEAVREPRPAPGRPVTANLLMIAKAFYRDNAKKPS
jgi:hypothetical protein